MRAACAPASDYSLVLPATAAKASSAAPAGIKVIGAVSPIAIGARFHVHSHLKLLIPGRGKLRPGQKFAIPENPGPHAKSPT